MRIIEYFIIRKEIIILIRGLLSFLRSREALWRISTRDNSVTLLFRFDWIGYCFCNFSSLQLISSLFQRIDFIIVSCFFYRQLYRFWCNHPNHHHSRCTSIRVLTSQSAISISYFFICNDSALQARQPPHSVFVSEKR